MEIRKADCSCGGDITRENRGGLIGYRHSKPFTRLHEHVFSFPDEGTARFD